MSFRLSRRGASKQSDVYSLGCVLFELCAGQGPAKIRLDSRRSPLEPLRLAEFADVPDFVITSERADGFLVLEASPTDVCGDEVCGESENGDCCPEDCGTCGNDVCDGDETTESCPADCASDVGPEPCLDASCEEGAGEDGGGCGCRAGGESTNGWIALLLLAALIRRRRSGLPLRR